MPILGDPGAVSRVGRKGGTEIFKYGQKSPWVPTLTELFPKIQADAGSWLGTKNALYYCAQSPNSFSRVLFVSCYTTAIVSITACLVPAPKKCTQSGNFQFGIKSPSDFKILSARKVKTLLQKYKLEHTSGIHVWIGHVLRKYYGVFKSYHDGWQPRQRRMEKWIHMFSSLYRDYSNSLTLSHASELFWRWISIRPYPSLRREWILSLLVCVLHKTWNSAFSQVVVQLTAKKCTKKRDARAKLLFCLVKLLLIWLSQQQVITLRVCASRWTEVCCGIGSQRMQQR